MTHPPRPHRLPTASAPSTAQAQRQLSIPFESPVLQELDPSERNRVVMQLALLLLQAAGVPGAGDDHDER
jgi:hypothetical protein